MSTIGIDFGTTNSTLCWYNPNTQRVEVFHPEGNHTAYVPSVIGYRENNPDNWYIGTAPKQGRGQRAWKIFDRFKMLLVEEDSARLQEGGFENEHQVREITGKFLNKLIAAYRDGGGPQAGRLESVVITRPEIWSSGEKESYRSAEILSEICKTLGVQLQPMLSEPEAACIYFAHQYQHAEGQNFNGHVLVCDYGGGTLDLCLCNVDGGQKTVKPLHSEGHGALGEHFGAAGVAYDEAMVTLLCQDNAFDDLLNNPVQKARLLLEFESQKISQAPHIHNAMVHFYETGENEEIFDLGDMPCRASDFDKAFTEVNKPMLVGSIRNMVAYINEQGIDSANPDQYRVILVGGFSQFCLVKRTLWEELGGQDEDDLRFKSHFSKEDIPLAIAKGAALVAARQWRVLTQSPYAMGFMGLVHTRNGQFKLEEFPFIPKGTSLEDCENPRFAPPHGYNVNVGPGTDLEIWLDFRGHRMRFNLMNLKGLSFEHMLPDPGFYRTENEAGRFPCVDICMTMDANRQYYIHVRDVHHKVKITSLGDIIKVIDKPIVEVDKPNPENGENRNG